MAGKYKQSIFRLTAVEKTQLLRLSVWLNLNQAETIRKLIAEASERLDVILATQAANQGEGVQDDRANN